MQAVCVGDNESEWSAVASFTTLDACDAPNNLAAEVTGNAVELSWEGYQEGYNVRYRASGFDGIYLSEPLLPDNEIGEWMTVPSDGNTLSLSVDELESNRSYEWQVQGINCDGNGGTTEWSEAATFTMPGPCAVPTDLNATNITAISACLNWTGVQESYNVRYRRPAHTKHLFSENFEATCTLLII